MSKSVIYDKMEMIHIIVKGAPDMYVMEHSGWVEVICGSMWSGKSEELIRRVRRATYGQLSVRVFKPVIDTRYEDEAVVSHNGSTTIARPVKSSGDILKYIDDDVDLIG